MGKVRMRKKVCVPSLAPPGLSPPPTVHPGEGEVLSGDVLQSSIVVCPVRLLEASAQTEVGELDVTLAVQEQVVGLDVPVDEAQLVDGLDGQGRLCHVELGSLLRQGVLLHQQGHDVPPWQELHDQVEGVRVLEGVEHLDHPGVVHLHQDVPLRPHVRHLLLLHHLRLPQHLHRVHVASVDLGITLRTGIQIT